jgi:hypothetical protein
MRLDARENERLGSAINSLDELPGDVPKYRLTSGLHPITLSAHLIHAKDS